MKTGEDSKQADVTLIQYRSARLWTLVKQLTGNKGNEKVYSALTKACREDNVRRLRKGGLKIIKGINSALVGDRHQPMGQPLRPPPDWIRRSFRGTGIQSAELNFWYNLRKKHEQRRKYRAAFPLASSLKRAVANNFLGNASSAFTKVLFIFVWPADCMHAAYISGPSSFQNEDEMLLAPYSVLEVQEIDDTDPSKVIITIKVMPDNKDCPEFLPIAVWH